MNIYKFIQSKDIREYNEKLNHRFTALESAYLIWHNDEITLFQKHTAWKTLMAEIPDETVKDHNSSAEYKLFELLRSFIKTDEKIIESFYKSNSDKYVYFYRLSENKDFSREQFGVAFVDYDSAKRSLDNQIAEYSERRFIYQIEYKKQSLLFPEKEISIITDMNGNILDVSWNGYIDNLDKERFFTGQWINVPTPFRVGDIVCYPCPDLSVRYEPFILNFISNWSNKDCLERGCADTKYDMVQKLSETGDISDMQAGGYFLKTDENYVYTGEFYSDEMLDYLKIEYYRGDYTDGRRVLLPLSLYIRKQIAADVFAKSCEIIKKQEEVKRLLDSIGIYDNLMRKLKLKD